MGWSYTRHRFIQVTLEGYVGIGIPIWIVTMRESLYQALKA